jgi:hypothetical protein
MGKLALCFVFFSSCAARRGQQLTPGARWCRYLPRQSSQTPPDWWSSPDPPEEAQVRARPPGCHDQTRLQTVQQHSAPGHRATTGWRLTSTSPFPPLLRGCSVADIRVRGGGHKYRALRLDVGNFSWGSESTLGGGEQASEGLRRGTGPGHGTGCCSAVCSMPLTCVWFVVMVLATWHCTARLLPLPLLPGSGSGSGALHSALLLLYCCTAVLLYCCTARASFVIGWFVAWRGHSLHP